jgi:hypothetical protein
VTIFEYYEVGRVKTFSLIQTLSFSRSVPAMAKVVGGNAGTSDSLERSLNGSFHVVSAEVMSSTVHLFNAIAMHQLSRRQHGGGD